jgi:hypothetical protein
MREIYVGRDGDWNCHALSFSPLPLAAPLDNHNVTVQENPLVSRLPSNKQSYFFDYEQYAIEIVQKNTSKAEKVKKKTSAGYHDEPPKKGQKTPKA